MIDLKQLQKDIYKNTYYKKPTFNNPEESFSITDGIRVQLLLIIVFDKENNIIYTKEIE